MPYPVPNDHERRALFGWLKQASSLTAWRRLYTYHQMFVDALTKAFEDEQNTPGVSPTIPTQWYTAVLDDHDAFAAALQRLERGDRRCFAFLGAPGHFSQGILHVEWWQDMYSGSWVGRNGFPVEDSIHWPNIAASMHDCLSALSDIGVVLQDRVIGNPAQIVELGCYLRDSDSSLIKLWNSQSALPSVPSKAPEVLVPTGKTIPCYGIWEPVRVGRATGTYKTRAGLGYELAPSWQVDGHVIDGCMNYLHGDFEAPTLAFQEDDPRRDGRPTTWRLVWRDDRYGDNPIPEEETRYVFVQPVPGEVLFKYG